MTRCRINLFILFICILGFSVTTNTIGVLAQDPSQLTDHQIIIRTQDGQKFTFNVEWATTQDQQERGLMNRARMPESAGMLFLFPDSGQRIFWMKDTLIPLDMLFLDVDGTIRHIHHNAKPQDLTKITSDKPAQAVLEINGGLCDTLGIEEGDTVIHPVFRNTLRYK